MENILYLSLITQEGEIIKTFFVIGSYITVICFTWILHNITYSYIIHISTWFVDGRLLKKKFVKSYFAVLWQTFLKFRLWKKNWRVFKKLFWLTCTAWNLGTPLSVITFDKGFSNSNVRRIAFNFNHSEISRRFCCSYLAIMNFRFRT